MLFGSMRFEEFVGELMISTLARYGGEVTREQVLLPPHRYICTEISLQWCHQGCTLKMFAV